jgi:vacuolar-type H+-ATPase subunit C/Vma6
LKQTLPAKPDLKIVLPRSRKGINVGGYIDNNNPHSVNHMILGNLGNYEVLLMACDDGDVIAYYIHLLENEVNQIRAVQSGLYSNIAP